MFRRHFDWAWEVDKHPGWLKFFSAHVKQKTACGGSLVSQPPGKGSARRQKGKPRRGGTPCANRRSALSKKEAETLSAVWKMEL